MRAAQHTERIQALLRFHPDHLSAMIRHPFSANGSGAKPGKVEYANAGECLWGVHPIYLLFSRFTWSGLHPTPPDSDTRLPEHAGTRAGERLALECLKSANLVWTRLNNAVRSKRWQVVPV